MNIHTDELQLAHLIKENIKSNIVLEIVPTLPENDKAKAEDTDDPEDQLHPHLLYGSSILTSTVMNQNDDIFLTEHTLPAIWTAVDTPFNDEHQEEDIIGHVTEARVLDSEGNVIDKDKVEADDESLFDVEVDFVVYKSIFPDISSEIEDGYENDNMFVSMECYIGQFDYGLVDADNNIKIVSRNDKTSFLTKYLRIYGGVGEWNGVKIGRVLKDICFAGMGKVPNPANTRSNFTRITKLEIEDVDAFIDDSLADQEVLYLARRNSMPKIENLDEAVAKIDELQAQLDSKDNKAHAAQLKEAQDAETALAEDLETERKKVEVAEAVLTERDELISTAKAELEAMTAERDEANEKLTKADNERKLTTRLAQMDELGIPCEDSEKEGISAMTDENFDNLVKFAKRITPKTEVEADANADVVEDNAEVVAEEVLSDVKEDKDATATLNEDEPARTMETVSASLSDALIKMKSK